MIVPRPAGAADPIRVALPPRLVPVFLGPAAYRGAWGGRGSGKTRSFAIMAAVNGIACAQGGKDGLIVCAREYLNAVDASSLAEVKAAIASEPWLAARYDVGERYIRTRDGRIDFAFVGLRHNLDSIKSKARIRLLWVDEAEPVSEAAWSKAIPTVREEGAEIWVTWNPERKGSATHKRFRVNPPAGAKIVELNWRDNPWFPGILDAVRREDMAKRPDSYAHIWEGDFIGVQEGAYFARGLADAKAQGRIGNVAPDPLMQLRTFWDIGTRDATAIWVAQFVGREVRVIDYYEAVGQPLATHLGWLRSEGYGQALCVLPHDGANENHITAVRFEDHVRAAGFAVEVVRNQGKGAAMQRVEAARRLFPSIWFHEPTTRAGLDALGWYHERRDDARGLGLGPEHDWSSHGADAFGLMCVAYEAPRAAAKIDYRRVGAVA